MGEVTWLLTDDKCLVDTILEMSAKGVSINEAFQRAANKLGKTLDACSRRWYAKFRDHYEAEISSIRNTIRRINDHNGPWMPYEDNKFLTLMIKQMIEGSTQSEALEQSALTLGRSVPSCSTRWYNHIKKRNKLTIENTIKEGKKKQMGKIHIKRWSNEEDQVLIDAMLEGAAKGLTNDQNWQLAADILGKRYHTVRLYWYQYLGEDYIEQLKENKAKFKAGQQLQTEIPVGETPVEEEAKTPEIEGKVEEVEQPVAEVPTAPTFDLSSLNEFVAMVQQITMERDQLKQQLSESNAANATLSAENDRLTMKLVEAEEKSQLNNELQTNYLEVLKAVEKARKFIVDSESGLSKASNE